MPGAERRAVKWQRNDLLWNHWDQDSHCLGPRSPVGNEPQPKRAEKTGQAQNLGCLRGMRRLADFLEIADYRDFVHGHNCRTAKRFSSK